MPPSFENNRTRRNLTPALEAIWNLTLQELSDIFNRGLMAGMSTHNEIKLAPLSQKTGPFYQHLRPLRRHLVLLLADSYRRYFKLALAHQCQTGRDPHKWAWAQLQPALGATLKWIRDWYILACDGENQWVQNAGSAEFVPGKTVSFSIPTAPPLPPLESWRAPAWLFEISLPDVGVGPLYPKNIPATDSEQRLGAAHTRLLLKGARRVFLWELGAAVERVRNEETAAAGAIPTEAVRGEKRGPNKRKGLEKRLKLYSAIQKALSGNPSLQGIELCAELDKRHAPPLYDWTKRGEWREGLTWKEAWRIPRLRKKIRRVRQEALNPR